MIQKFEQIGADFQVGNTEDSKHFLPLVRFLNEYPECGYKINLSGHSDGKGEKVGDNIKWKIQILKSNNLSIERINESINNQTLCLVEEKVWRADQEEMENRFIDDRLKYPGIVNELMKLLSEPFYRRQNFYDVMKRADYNWAILPEEEKAKFEVKK